MSCRTEAGVARNTARAISTRVPRAATATRLLNRVLGVYGYSGFRGDQQRQYLVSLWRERRSTSQKPSGRDHRLSDSGALGPTLDSMAHVGQIGTFLRPEWRRRGIGDALFQRTADFATQTRFSEVCDSGTFVQHFRAGLLSAIGISRVRPANVLSTMKLSRLAIRDRQSRIALRAAGIAAREG
jgi:GNAT superfamily N-acetyltransferase